MVARKMVMAAVAGVLVGGCATVPKEAGFGRVRDEVKERTGHVVQWRGNTAEDAEVDAAVGAMLAGEMKVDEAVQIALLNNRRLQAKFEDLGIAQAELVQAGLLKNPTFAASWRFPDKAPNGTDSEYSVAGDFLELLILPLRKKMAEREFEGTKLSVAWEVLELSAEVKRAYYTMQGREQLLGRLRVMEGLNQAAAELADRQHEVGTLNELGLAGQQAILDQSRIDVAQAEAQLAADREEMNRLLGLSGEQTGWKIAVRLPEIPAREISVADLEGAAMRQRLDLGAARERAATAAEALGITRDYRYFASVEAGVDTERGTDGQHVTGPTLSVQIPIFDQGQARVAKAEAQYRQLWRRYEGMTTDACSEVRAARDRMLAERALAERYKALVSERGRIVSLTLQQYNGMLKGPYDLILAKQSEMATEQAHVEAWRDYWIARAELERAVGGKLPAAAAATTQGRNHDKSA